MSDGQKANSSEEFAFCNFQSRLLFLLQLLLRQQQLRFIFHCQGSKKLATLEELTFIFSKAYCFLLSAKSEPKTKMELACQNSNDGATEEWAPHLRKFQFQFHSITSKPDSSPLHSRLATILPFHSIPFHEWEESSTKLRRP